MSLPDSLALFFFFGFFFFTIYHVTLAIRSELVNSENSTVFFFTGVEKRRKQKHKICMGLNFTLLAFYETSITKKKITIITCTRETRYLFHCKELCLKRCSMLRRI